MADVVRFTEAISSFVLDAGEAVSYRSLASQVGGESAALAQALAQFYEQNGSGVGAMHVSVERNASTIKTTKKMDPRARVVRLSVVREPAAQVYGVYPSTLENAAADDAFEAMALALWAQERKVRNDLFAKTSKHQPLSCELKAFYQSDVHFAEATSRSDAGGIQGEEAVTVFDTIKTSTTGRTQTSTAAVTKPSFFKGSASSSTSANTTTSSASSAAKGNSFFKSSSTAASAKPKTSAPAAKSKAPTPAEAKRIDAGSMDNVLTVDSDDDSDADDDDAPKFVKSAPAAKPRSKRVMISDDEDEDEDDDGFEEVTAPPAKKETRPSAKRKLSESPERPAKQAKAASPKKSESPKRKREVEVEEQDDEPQAEEDPVPTGPIKRRHQVTKTVINDMGYMVTEKVWEEVEVSVEELAKERAEAKKKQAAAQAAAAAQKARAAAAEKAAAYKASKAAAGPPKQKKLDFFFARK